MELMDIARIRESRSPLHIRCGVYFLFENDALVYIGCSINVASRIGSHADGRKGYKPDSFFFLPCARKKMARLERKYIEKYSPPFNKMGVKKEKASSKAAIKFDRWMNSNNLSNPQAALLISAHIPKSQNLYGENIRVWRQGLCVPHERVRMPIQKATKGKIKATEWKDKR